jgi:hypothetical protein
VESDGFTGRPDERWTEAQKAEYERLKAKYLAEMPKDLELLAQPTVPADDLIELLDRLLRERGTNNQ